MKVIFIIFVLIFPIVSLAYAHTDLENAKIDYSIAASEYALAYGKWETAERIKGDLENSLEVTVSEWNSNLEDIGENIIDALGWKTVDITNAIKQGAKTVGDLFDRQTLAEVRAAKQADIDNIAITIPNLISERDEKKGFIKKQKRGTNPFSICVQVVINSLMKQVKKDTDHYSAAATIHTTNAIVKISGCTQQLLIVVGVVNHLYIVSLNNIVRVPVERAARLTMLVAGAFVISDLILGYLYLVFHLVTIVHIVRMFFRTRCGPKSCYKRYQHLIITSALSTYYCRRDSEIVPTDGLRIVGGNSDSRSFQAHQLALD